MKRDYYIFIGRKDDQIKLRGFRIELQEITSTLRKCNGIKAATVAIKEVKGDKAICAYMVLSNECSVDEIKDQLAIFSAGIHAASVLYRNESVAYYFKW